MQLGLSNKSWKMWILLSLFTILFLWILFGRKPYAYIGINPILDPDEYIDEIPTIGYLYKGLPVKSPYIISEIIDDINKDEHQINCVPYVPNGIIKKTQPIPGCNKKRMDSRGEQTCREILEDYYKKPFPKIRPGFIRNPETQSLLELDGYNSELGIAFEYNGIQHYNWPNFTNQQYDEFKSQVRRDQFKLECCDRHNVYLITIPYTVPYEDIRDYIIYYLPENVVKRLKNETTN